MLETCGIISVHFNVDMFYYIFTDSAWKFSEYRHKTAELNPSLSEDRDTEILRPIFLAAEF